LTGENPRDEDVRRTGGSETGGVGVGAATVFGAKLATGSAIRAGALSPAAATTGEDEVLDAEGAARAVTAESIAGVALAEADATALAALGTARASASWSSYPYR